MKSADDATVTIYRAVGLNEAEDIRTFGGFRPGPSSAFVEGKWFADSFDDAVRWGKAMPPIDRSRSFRVASVTIPVALLATLDDAVQLDGIGPAHFVRHDQLPSINAAGAIVLSDAFVSRSSVDAR